MKYLGTLLLMALASTAILFGAGPPHSEVGNPVVQHIKDISWMVQMEKGTGSGVMFTRKNKSDNVHFIWTAGHNIAKQQKVDVRLHPKTKKLTVMVTYPDVEIMQREVQDGRIVAHHYYYAQVIRYSEVTHGEDLALLRVRKKNITNKSVDFYRGNIPAIGTNIWHIGAAGGMSSPSTLTYGNTSSTGLLSNNIVYDQYTIPAQRGCSGGGVFLASNGKCIGLLVAASLGEAEKNSNISFARPIRTIINYAKRAKCMWAIDKSIDLPTDEEIFNTPIEDIPIPIPEIKIED